MRNAKVRFGAIVGVGLAAGVTILGGVPSGWHGPGAAIAQQRNQGQQSLDRMMRSLRAVDTAYASGNSAEARSRFAEARRSWNSISRRISTREAREQQLLLDSLDQQLKSGAPATQVKSTVDGILDELREDIERELR